MDNKVYQRKIIIFLLAWATAGILFFLLPFGISFQFRATIFIIVTFLCCLYLCSKKTVLSEADPAIKKQNHILQLALSHINISIFEYDPTSGHILFIDNSLPLYGLPKELTEGPSQIVGENIINSSYIQNFYELFEKIRLGEKRTSATIKTDYGSHPGWDRIILSNVYDESGNPLYAIGTIQNVTDRVVAELHYSKEEQYRQAMLADASRVYEINVTRDRFMKLESIKDSTDYEHWNVYSKAMAHLCETVVFKEDWEVFKKVADRDSLLLAYAQGCTELYCEYRTLNTDGSFSWSSSTTHLLKDPLSEDIKAFTYAKNITDKKMQELALRKRAEYDPLTGLFNRGAAQKAIEEILSARDNHSFHGFLSLDLDGFKMVNDNFGHMMGDTVLVEVAKTLSNALRSDDILARMGGDEFVIFLKDAGNMSYIEKVAARLCQSIRDLSIHDALDYHISLSIGIALYPSDGATFTELYRNSDLALYYAKEHGKNRYITYSPLLHPSIENHGDKNTR